VIVLSKDFWSVATCKMRTICQTAWFSVAFLREHGWMHGYWLYCIFVSFHLWSFSCIISLTETWYENSCMLLYLQHAIFHVVVQTWNCVFFDTTIIYNLVPSCCRSSLCPLLLVFLSGNFIMVFMYICLWAISKSGWRQLGFWNLQV
jgi:hypothetical protein